MSLNAITLVGRAGRDPELRSFESGTMVARLSLAVDRSRDEPPDWFQLEIWGKQAQVAVDYVRKGSLIGVLGRMTFEQWTDRSTGEQRSRPVVKVNRLALLGTRRDHDATPSPPTGGTAASGEGNASTSTASGRTSFSGTPPATAAPSSWDRGPLSDEEVPF
jgi:single-strand DNA-binding protein